MKFCIGSGSVNKQYMTIFLFPWQLLCKMLTRRGLCVGCFRVRHCEKATELQAVETLLISDELFRYVCACAWVGACMYACVCKGIGSVLYQSCSGVCVCVGGCMHVCTCVYVCMCKGIGSVLYQSCSGVCLCVCVYRYVICALHCSGVCV